MGASWCVGCSLHAHPQGRHRQPIRSLWRRREPHILPAPHIVGGGARKQGCGPHFPMENRRRISSRAQGSCEALALTSFSLSGGETGAQRGGKSGTGCGTRPGAGFSNPKTSALSPAPHSVCWGSAERSWGVARRGRWRRPEKEQSLARHGSAEGTEPVLEGHTEKELTGAPAGETVHTGERACRGASGTCGRLCFRDAPPLGVCVLTMHRAELRGGW